MKVQIIEDDASFARLLGKRLEQHGFSALLSDDKQSALAVAREHEPEYVVMDVNLQRENSLSFLPELRSVLPNAKIVMLTGYGTIASAVEAIKNGADEYLTKPIKSQELISVLKGEAINLDNGEQIQSPSQVEWAHIQQVLSRNDGNVSATARELGMHRRTLQRKLLKKPKTQQSMLSPNLIS